MSKSLGNYVGVREAPGEMFGKLMSLPDRLMPEFFTLLTDLPEEAIREALAGHPRDAKELLAREVVEIYHDAEAAAAAAEEFRRVFSRRETPAEMPDLQVPAGTVGVIDLVVMAGHASSRSDARRLISGGGVSLNGMKIRDLHADVSPPDGAVLQTGKRRFARIRTGG
jgi:tyrosyl-tRNA synthetase